MEINVPVPEAQIDQTNHKTYIVAMFDKFTLIFPDNPDWSTGEGFGEWDEGRIPVEGVYRRGDNPFTAFEEYTTQSDSYSGIYYDADLQSIRIVRMAI